MIIATRALSTIVVLAAVAVSGAFAQDPGHSPARGVGTWKLNLEESIAPQGRHFNPYTVVVRRADEILDFTYHGFHDGKPYEFTYSAKADGEVRDMGGGMRAAMVRLPSGNYEARLWLPDGSFENKFCQIVVGGNKQVCLATLTQPDGSVVFFKQVQDRQ
ncbi:MAG: hypothetical protein NAOJABEB_01808 [Steroidobacteraceae bacterium]|nr:hypothetical protein [Steroidobacteraceae bacterium]